MNTAIRSTKFQSLSENSYITSSITAAQYLRGLMKSDVEEFWAMALSSSKKVIKAKMIFRGTVDACLVHPRDIFRFAIFNNASSIIVAHNHPSGDRMPSHSDRVLTQKLVKAGKLLQLPVVDHLILAEADYYSFLDSGLLQES